MSIYVEKERLINFVNDCFLIAVAVVLDKGLNFLAYRDGRPETPFFTRHRMQQLPGRAGVSPFPK